MQDISSDKTVAEDNTDKEKKNKVLKETMRMKLTKKRSTPREKKSLKATTSRPSDEKECRNFWNSGTKNTMRGHLVVVLSFRDS